MPSICYDRLASVKLNRISIRRRINFADRYNTDRSAVRRINLVAKAQVTVPLKTTRIRRVRYRHKRPIIQLLAAARRATVEDLGGRRLEGRALLFPELQIEALGSLPDLFGHAVPVMPDNASSAALPLSVSSSLWPTSLSSPSFSSWASSPAGGVASSAMVGAWRKR